MLRAGVAGGVLNSIFETSYVMGRVIAAEFVFAPRLGHGQKGQSSQPSRGLAPAMPCRGPAPSLTRKTAGFW